MELCNNITFLSKPKINAKDLIYIRNRKEVYVNLFEIKMKKQLTLYQYPYTVSPPIGIEDILIKNKLFKHSNKKIKSIFGDCFISGFCLYSMKEIKENNRVTCALYLNARTEYLIEFSKFKNKRTIEQNDIQKDPLSKQFIEMIIKDILYSNPKLEFYKDVFVMTNRRKTIETNNVSISFYPGFKTSFVETDRGNYLNVTLKNKIIQNETIYDYINQYKYKNNKDLQNEIKIDLKGRSFKVCYAKRNYKIDDILFDKTPKNVTINYEGKTINLIDYYSMAHNLKIKDQDQPLILVRRMNCEGDPISLHFVPEFCSLSGLEDDATKDGFFMKELEKYTKLEPIDRVKQTNEFMNLLSDYERDSKHPDRLSSKEKYDLYGIEVKPTSQLFDAYYMEETKLCCGNNKNIRSSDIIFPVLQKKDMTKWILLYEQNNYCDADNIYNNLNKASKAFGLKIAEPEWVEMNKNSSAKDWTSTADDYFGKNKKDFEFAIFLLGRNDKIYAELKRHSLCRNGYVSQVVKAKTILRKGVMHVCSKILLQINAKLGGISFKAIQDKSINDRKIMVIGVDSSHINGKGTGVGMVATINDSFTNFFNKEEIIKEKNNREQLQYNINTFIENAIEVYKKENKEYPKGIIIYRQGVSLQQKEFLKTEIAQIDFSCKTHNILYYYILVNTKVNFKFFEKINGKLENASSGLLIIDGITNRNFFEFYIQPQEVKQGSATPTCFHVAYGNLDIPELIPKFTYDLCHIYWQGTVATPNVIKAAEKLSKMIIKYTNSELNKNLEKGQAYL